jgi:hypothetical protein
MQPTMPSKLRSPTSGPGVVVVVVSGGCVVVVGGSVVVVVGGGACVVVGDRGRVVVVVRRRVVVVVVEPRLCGPRTVVGVWPCEVVPRDVVEDDDDREVVAEPERAALVVAEPDFRWLDDERVLRLCCAVLDGSASSLTRDDEDDDVVAPAATRVSGRTGLRCTTNAAPPATRTTAAELAATARFAR